MTITKGPVYVAYPLTYQQAYNFNPTEVQCAHPMQCVCGRPWLTEASRQRGHEGFPCLGWRVQQRR